MTRRTLTKPWPRKYHRRLSNPYATGGRDESPAYCYEQNENFDFQLAWRYMTPTEQQATRDKAAWEHMTLSAVLLEWPSLMYKAIKRGLGENPNG